MVAHRTMSPAGNSGERSLRARIEDFRGTWVAQRVTAGGGDSNEQREDEGSGDSRVRHDDRLTGARPAARARPMSRRPTARSSRRKSERTATTTPMVTTTTAAATRATHARSAGVHAAAATLVASRASRRPVSDEPPGRAPSDPRLRTLPVSCPPSTTRTTMNRAGPRLSTAPDRGATPLRACRTFRNVPSRWRKIAATSGSSPQP
jgi:hypothetical protein